MFTKRTEPPADLRLRDTRRTAPQISLQEFPSLMAMATHRHSHESNQMSRGTEISMASKKKGAVVRKDDVSCHFFRAHGVQFASLKFDAALDFSGGDYGEPFTFLFVWGQQVQD